MLHIDNPLDTTWWEPGAVAWNNLPDGGHVWIFPTVEEGIQATVSTLLDGSYPTIVDHLRRSVPRDQWGDCCGELATWGTGCAWLQTYYGAAPGALEADVQNPLSETLIWRLCAVAGIIDRSATAPDGEAMAAYFDIGTSERAKEVSILKAVTTVGSGGQLTAAQQAELDKIAADAAAARASISEVQARVDKDLTA